MELMPSPLTLELTRHELFSLPPDTPAVGEAVRAEVSSCGRPPFFAVARVVVNAIQDETEYHRVYFREEGRPEDEIFSVSVEPIDYNADGTLPLIEKLLRTVPSGCSSRSVSRFWSSPDLPFGLGFTSEGGCQVVANHVQHKWGRNDFEWSEWCDDKQLWDWNSLQLDLFCWQLINEPKSELNFFLEWQKLGDDEKTRRCLFCEGGEWSELSRLSKWVLQLLTHRFGTYQQGSKKSFWCFLDNHPIFAHHFLTPWQSAICEIIKPSFWPHTPLCVYDWRVKVLANENAVTCDVPTQHELLEAQLGLRAFLRPHLSAEEIEALFVP